ncbi:hypothetical protein HNQ60_001360 [Povalibacter uvarum]|uniref:Uncharacterized protein n=1 Tax=Povalibacter uvarum TaxID=732238 RepID=A0A841HK22_9GAMM|nr:hypothetical protein [Povalibacter uvarum]MBB6092482.1 hypothetical protein [Povalibacter uvarum]
MTAENTTAENTTAENAHLMTELSIVRDGRYYRYEGYCYERLADAVAYAAVVRARQARPVEPVAEQLTSVDVPNAVDGLSVTDHLLMFELAITFENGSFVFNGFRYDRLVDAANYARLIR